MSLRKRGYLEEAKTGMDLLHFLVTKIQNKVSKRWAKEFPPEEYKGSDRSLYMMRTSNKSTKEVPELVALALRYGSYDLMKFRNAKKPGLVDVDVIKRGADKSFKNKTIDEAAKLFFMRLRKAHYA